MDQVPYDMIAKEYLPDLLEPSYKSLVTKVSSFCTTNRMVVQGSVFIIKSFLALDHTPPSIDFKLSVSVFFSDVLVEITEHSLLPNEVLAEVLRLRQAFAAWKAGQ